MARTIPAARRLVEAFPNRVEGYDLLSSGYRLMGQQDQALPLYHKAMRLDPRGSNMFNRYGYQGFSLMMSGRYKEAIAAFESSFPANPEAPKGVLSTRHRVLAGRLCARRAARQGATGDCRVRPTVVVQYGSHERAVRVAEPCLRRADQDADERALRLAGQRDHANEYADFGVPPDDALHSKIADYTPTKAPGTDARPTRRSCRACSSRGIHS